MIMQKRQKESKWYMLRRRNHRRKAVVEPLVSDAETALGWYGNIAAN